METPKVIARSRRTRRTSAETPVLLEVERGLMRGPPTRRCG